MKYTIKDIILVILVIAVIYLIYKTNCGLNHEKFSATDDSINQAVNEQYKKDQNLNLKEINELYSIVVNSLIDSY